VASSRRWQHPLDNAKNIVAFTPSRKAKGTKKAFRVKPLALRRQEIRAGTRYCALYEFHIRDTVVSALSPENACPRACQVSAISIQQSDWDLYNH
jgi:hypothetical protein